MNRSYWKEKKGYAHEIKFWELHLAKKDRFKPKLLNLLNPKKRVLEFPEILLESIKESFGINKKLKTLDVGCGPVSSLAWVVDSNLLKVIGIDPLAEIYKKLMKKYGYKYPIIPKKGVGEKLLKKYKEGSFDIVYSRNSLDHSLSPKKTFLNMYKLVKNNGLLCIESKKREGTHARWAGIHKHDLNLEKNNVVYYDKKGKKITLNKNLKLIPIRKYKQGEKLGDWFGIVFRKFPE